MVAGLRNLRDVFVPHVHTWHIYDAKVGVGLGRVARGGRATETLQTLADRQPLEVKGWIYQDSQDR